MNTAAWRTHARKLASGVLPVLLVSPCSDASELRVAALDPTEVRAGSSTAHRPLTTNDRLGDLLDHPAFKGFSRQMLPWDDRVYDASMPLEEIGQLLPYHSQVDTAVVVSGLNRMLVDVNAGRSVFCNIYTEAQRQADLSLNNTGLFFFRGKPGAPFAVIAPGGGFAYVGSVHEGFPYAQEISQRGFNAFVLKYRAGQGGHVATKDMAAAISTIFQNADTLQVSTEGYSLWGSSAGARMAAAIGSHGTAEFGGAALPKPAVAVIAYTGHSEVTSDEPATFVVVGDRDHIAPPAAMEQRVAALKRAGALVEYHRYPAVGHGFGTGQGTSAQGWIGLAVHFWEKVITNTT